MSAAELAAAQRSLSALRAAAAGCRACHLWENATQTVFGEGRRAAEVMMIGEQPGDKEDLAGRPFAGPAGRVLDEALGEVGIERDHVYLTNAVKHFKWKARGKRRIHDKPNAAELAACRPWLDAELAAVKPQVVVLLGATAAQALLGPSIRIGRDRGRPIDSDLAELVTITTHPSAILRAGDDREREQAMEAFVEDLRMVSGWLSKR